MDQNLLWLVPVISFLTAFVYSWARDKIREKRASKKIRPFSESITIREGTTAVMVTMMGGGGGGSAFPPPVPKNEPDLSPIKESSMKVYIAYCNDRHTDPEIKLFKDPENAIAHVKTFMEEHVAHPEGIEEKTIDGYLFFLGYQFESDHAFVLEEELHD